MKQTNNRFIHRTNKVLDKSSKLSVILLSANPGYRTRSYGAKSLIQVTDKKTLLQHQVDCLKSQYSNIEIIVVLGYEADKILKKKIKECRFVENVDFDKTGEYEQIRLGLNNVENDSVLIVNGDLYFNHVTCNNLIKNHSYLSITKNTNSLLEVGVNHDEDSNLTLLSYGLVTPLWAEIAFFTGNEFVKLKDEVFDRDKNKLLFMEAVNNVIEADGQFKTYSNSDTSLFKISTVKDIKAIKYENSNS